MNFFPVPPTIEAELYVRIPDEVRCTGVRSEWGDELAGFKGIFLEGPVTDKSGNIYFVDIPFGRILRVDSNKQVTVVATYDGEPNGLAVTPDGDIVIADYKQVSNY